MNEKIRIKEISQILTELDGRISTEYHQINVTSRNIHMISIPCVADEFKECEHCGNCVQYKYKFMGDVE